MRRGRFAFLLAAALATGAFSPPAAAQRSGTVVELFTSHGCSSCPPADAFIGELAKREDVIALNIRITHPDAHTAMLKSGAGPKQRRPATVWIMFYDNEHVTRIARGENRGRDLVNTNVVRSVMRIGTWLGDAKQFTLSLDAAEAKGRDGCAVIVQEAVAGPILGAVSFPLPRNPS